MYKPIAKSSKLANVCYDIRGPVLDKAREMEDEGLLIALLRPLGGHIPHHQQLAAAVGTSGQGLGRHLKDAQGLTQGQFVPELTAAKLRQEGGEGLIVQGRHQIPRG